MPSYNQGHFIEESILSVIKQNYPNLEFFIFDGGSTDSTVEIIKKYEDKIDYWVSEKDNGQSDAINKGFKKATGEIVNWICSDDILLPGSLFAVSNYFNKYREYDVIFGNSYSINGNGNLLRKNKKFNFSSKALWAGFGLITQPAAFQRKSVIDKVGLLDEELEYCMDFDWYLRMDLQNLKFKYVNEFLCKFRYHNQSKSVAGRNYGRETIDFLVDEKYRNEKHINKNVRKFYLNIFRLKMFIINTLSLNYKLKYRSF